MAEGDREAYKSTADHLQSILLIFLGFLLFVSFFIFFPYYPVVNSYKTLVNIDTLTNQTKEEIQNIADVVMPEYRKANLVISNDTDHRAYVGILNNALKKADNASLTNEDKNMLSQKMNGTNPSCYDSTIATYKAWKTCNDDIYLSDLTKRLTISINSNMKKQINEFVDMISQSVNEIIANNKGAKVFSEQDMIQLGKNTSEWRNDIDIAFDLIDNTTILSYNNVEKLFLKDPQSLIPRSIKNQRVEIEEKMMEFNERIKEMSFPIVGQTPFNFTQLLLSFPIIIIIGFSYISLQIKKVIIIHRKLKLDRKNDRVFLSWVDPIQGIPERIYPVLAIILPAVLFVVFWLMIISIWYQNAQYQSNYNLLTDDYMYLSVNIRDIVTILNIFGVAVFAYCYYQILKAWLGKIEHV